MRYLSSPRRCFSRVGAILLLTQLGSAVAQDSSLSEYLALRTRFGTNRLLSFEERATNSTGAASHHCEWSRTTNGFRFERRRIVSEDSGEVFRATLRAPDHDDTLLKYRILRRETTNRYESPAAFYLSDRAITGCTRFTTNIDGSAAIAFELTYRPPQPPGPVPIPTRQLVLFDQQGLLRAIHTLESTTTSAVFPRHVSTVFDAYSTKADPGEAIRWNQYPVTRAANDAEWSKALKEEIEVKLVLRWLLELPWGTKLLLILLPVVVLVGALLSLIFGRARSNPE